MKSPDACRRICSGKICRQDHHFRLILIPLKHPFSFWISVICFFFCMNKSIEYQKIFKVIQWQRLYSLEYESVLKINIRVGEMNSDRWHWWQHKHCCIGPNSYIKIYNLSKGWKMLPLFLIPISNFQNSISKLLILKFTFLVQSIAAFDSKNTFSK